MSRRSVAGHVRAGSDHDLHELLPLLEVDLWLAVRVGLALCAGCGGKRQETDGRDQRPKFVSVVRAHIPPRRGQVGIPATLNECCDGPFEETLGRFLPGLRHSDIFFLNNCSFVCQHFAQELFAEGGGWGLGGE